MDWKIQLWTLLTVKAPAFVVQLIPISILLTTLVCLVAMLVAGATNFGRRIAGDQGKQYCPTMVSGTMVLGGVAALAWFGQAWIDASGAPGEVIQILDTQFTAAGFK